MPDLLDAPSPARRLRARRLAPVIFVATLVVAVTGATLTVIGVARAGAAETARQCAAALEVADEATDRAASSLRAAHDGLAAVRALGIARTSASDAAASAHTAPGARPAELVALGGAHSGGTQHVVAVAQARDALQAISIPTTCTALEHAEVIATRAEDSADAAADLDARVTALRAALAVADGR